MIEKLRYFLEREGFKKLSLSADGIDVYFTIENRYVNAILLADHTSGSSLSYHQYEDLSKKTSWKFYDGGNIDVHLLSIIVTDDLSLAREIARDDQLAWFWDVNTNTLVIDDGKAEDFYGMRSQFENWILADYDPRIRSTLHDMVYDPKGKPYYQSIFDRSIVNHAIFVINALVFTCCILTGGKIMVQLGDLDYYKIFSDGQWYRMITSMFLHGDMTHITGNMLILYYVGDMVERAFGHLKYLGLYLFSGILANVVSLWFSYYTHDFTPSIGASGAIFGVVGAILWIAIRNHGQYEVLDVRKILFMIGYSLYSGFASTNVDNAAHVGGVIAGLLFAIIMYRRNPKKNDKK